MSAARRLLPLLSLLLLLWPGGAAAEERILHYLSDVAIERDATLEVAETIRLVSEGDRIRRGIYRDFPTRYTDAAGRRTRVGFEVVSVERDGAPEPWTTEPLSNGVRVRIGDPDVLIGPGEHVYVIRYRTTRQLGFFDEFDELYWNATGNGWAFPIEVAEARIRLAAPVRFGARAAYTGPQGARGSYAEVVEEAPGDIRFRTTAPLGPEEGLTVAVAWPKGVVTPPSPETRAGWWLADNGPFGVGAIMLALILGYYYFAWRRAGRGPPAGTVVPIFSPPEGLSAAATRYVSEMGSDNRVFAAAIIEAGVRGRLRLVEGEEGWFTRPKTTIEKRADEPGLPPPEAAMLTEIFSGRSSILMDKANHKAFIAAREALDAGLKRAFEGRLFLRNWSWSVRGLALMLLAVGLTGASLTLFSPGDYEAGSRGLALAGLGGLVVAGLLYLAVRAEATGWGVLGRIAAALIAAAASLAVLATAVLALESGRIIPLLIPLLALPVVISAFWWMAAPTREGRRVMDRIEGFRHYLSIAEEDRLQTLHPPEKTPELFERYLPYAIALEVENEWAARFASVLAAAAAAGQTQAMTWYSGHSSPWSDPDGFADRVGSSFAGAVSSASTAPGSSSGSGGGGSSGGGGGGGGGGGW